MSYDRLLRKHIVHWSPSSRGVACQFVDTESNWIRNSNWWHLASFFLLGLSALDNLLRFNVACTETVNCSRTRFLFEYKQDSWIKLLRNGSTFGLPPEELKCCRTIGGIFRSMGSEKVCMRSSHDRRGREAYELFAEFGWPRNFLYAKNGKQPKCWQLGISETIAM